MALGLAFFLCLFLTAAVSSTIDCNFEDANICGYQQSTNDQLDWTRHSGSTSTVDTGPYNDHTQGNAQGHYLYLESSTPGRPGYTATLITPTLTLTPGPSCLTFWYSMHGAGTGTLAVMTTSPSDVSHIDVSHRTMVWSLTGNQGPGWHQAHVALDVSNPIKVIFQGTLSSSSTSNFYYGDMAIDDVMATTGRCDGLEISSTLTTTTYRTTPRYVGTSPANCNFEQGFLLCGYQQLSSTGPLPHDDLDWTLNQGPTPTSGTGPDNDHTLGNSLGHYVYVNGSSPNRHATLISPAVRQAQSCLTFWYSMSGAAMGQLTVLTATPHLQNLHVVWHLAGNQGPGWKVAQVDIVNSNLYEIIFNGLTGHGHLSDIAIDDIVLYNGPCEAPSTTTRQVTTTTTPTTAHPTSTTTGPTTTHITYLPSRCQQCEGLQCFTGPQTVYCTPQQPLCSTHVTDSASDPRTVKKGCISLPECDQWIPSDSELLHCLSVDQQVTDHDLDCLFCCHGDLCNIGPSFIPNTDSWVGQNQHKILLG